MRLFVFTGTAERNSVTTPEIPLFIKVLNAGELKVSEVSICKITLMELDEVLSRGFRPENTTLSVWIKELFTGLKTTKEVFFTGRLMVIILLPLSPLCYQINKIWAMLLISVLVI